MTHTKLVAAILLSGSCFAIGCGQNKTDTIATTKDTLANVPTNTGNKDACYDPVGVLQTPIDIVTGSTRTFNSTGMLSVTHRATTMTIKADVAHEKEYNIKAVLKNAGDTTANYVTFQDARYHFAAFHFHAPSEHLQNGRHYAMEAHTVFEKNGRPNERVVIGTYLDTTQKNAEIERLWTEFGKVTKPSDAAYVDNFDIYSLTRDPNVTGYYTYPGSLTTGEYHEGVLWIVSMVPMNISPAQLNQFLSFKVNNDSIGRARGRQDVGNRIILRSR